MGAWGRSFWLFIILQSVYWIGFPIYAFGYVYEVCRMNCGNHFYGALACNLLCLRSCKLKLYNHWSDNTSITLRAVCTCFWFDRPSWHFIIRSLNCSVVTSTWYCVIDFNATWHAIRAHDEYPVSLMCSLSELAPWTFCVFWAFLICWLHVEIGTSGKC